MCKKQRGNCWPPGAAYFCNTEMSVFIPLLSLQERQRGATVIQAFLQQRHVSQTHQLVGNQAAAGGPEVREQIIHI